MGTDLFSSSSGPGIIGSAIALIVILGFSSLFFFAFDERFQGGESIGKTIRDEARSVERLGRNIADSEKRLEEYQGLRDLDRQVIEAEVAARFSAERLAELKGQVAAAEAGLVAGVQRFDDYKQAYRTSERAAAVGETFAELKTISGKVYKEANVRDVDAMRMQIRHSGGIAGVPVEELPLDLQDRFQINAEEKASQLISESKRLAAVDRRVGLHELQIKIAELQKSNSDFQYQIDQDKASLENSAGIRETLLKRQSDLRSQIAASIRSGVSKAPQIEPQIRKIDARIAAIDSAVPALRAKILTDEESLRSSKAQLESLQIQLKTMAESDGVDSTMDESP